MVRTQFKILNAKAIVILEPGSLILVRISSSAIVTNIEEIEMTNAIV